MGAQINGKGLKTERPSHKSVILIWRAKRTVRTEGATAIASGQFIEIFFFNSDEWLMTSADSALLNPF